VEERRGAMGKKKILRWQRGACLLKAALGTQTCKEDN